MITEKKTTYMQKGVSYGFQLEHTLRDTLIKHGYTFYRNGVFIQPGDRKSNKQQLKMRFND